MTAIETTEKTIVVQYGILDWEACHERFDQRPAADVYTDPKFSGRAIWYMTQGLYKFYYAQVPDSKSQISICEAVFWGQGNNYENTKFEPKERSFSMSDIVVLSNKTVWLCTKGWECLNPGVI